MPLLPWVQAWVPPGASQEVGTGAPLWQGGVTGGPRVASQEAGMLGWQGAPPQVGAAQAPP